MTVRNRETLRHFFDEGQLPTQDHFGDLIDSMLNMSDEGFSKTAENGFEVATPMGYDALISFYREQDRKHARWSMGFGRGEQLHIQTGGMVGAAQRPPVVALANDGCIGLGTATPAHRLEVAGVVASEGRIGTWRAKADETPLAANGEWQNLTGELQGCQAFEVMAGASAPLEGRHALLRAVAMNTYNPGAGWLDFFSRKKRIRCQHAWYGRRCDRLELRWVGTSGRNASYRLQVRTGCDYGAKAVIRAHLTRLWFDEPRADAAAAPERPPSPRAVP